MAVKFLAPFVIHPEVALYFGPHCWKKNAWAIRVNHKVPGSYPYPILFSRVTCRNCLYGGRWGSSIGNCSPFFHLTLISFQNSSFECYLLEASFSVVEKNYWKVFYPFFRIMYVYFVGMCDDGGPEHQLTLTEQWFAAQQRLRVSWDP